MPAADRHSTQSSCACQLPEPSPDVVENPYAGVVLRPLVAPGAWVGEPPAPKPAARIAGRRLLGRIAVAGDCESGAHDRGADVRAPYLARCEEAAEFVCAGRRAGY